MKWLAALTFLLTMSGAFALESDKDMVEVEAALSKENPETVKAAQDFLAETDMNEFDAKRLKRVRKKHGEEVANEIYAEWISSKNFGDSCTNLIGSCDYYLCRENLGACGVKGYYLAFGYQYCKKSFTKLSQRVSPKGQQWLTDVATCLQQRVESDISPSMECKEIKKASIDSHESCYKETNFCKQKFGDVLKVVGMLSPELGKPRMILLGLRIVKNCIF